MSELSDMVGADVAILNINIEKLDLGGYIERDSLLGSGFYSFKVTDWGKEKLIDLTEEQKQLADNNLTHESLKVLRIAKNDPNKLVELVTSEELSSLKLSTLLAKLIRNGYLIEGGFWKRTISMSGSGEQILEKFESVKTA